LNFVKDTNIKLMLGFTEGLIKNAKKFSN